MKKIITLIMIGLLSFNMAGCTLSKTKGEKAIRKVIEANVEAYNNKDISAYMSTIHPSSPGYKATSTALEEVFSKIDSQITLLNIEIKLLNKEEAEATCIQKVIAKTNQNPIKKEVYCTHLLKKKNNKWYLFGTKILKTKPVN